MLKTTIKTVIYSGLALAASVMPVFAQLSPEGVPTDICELVGNVLTFIYSIAGVIALVLLVMGGVQYMSSGGDKIAVEQARGRITAAIVGLVIVFGAWLVINQLVIGTVLKATGGICAEK
uniref:TrbC/VIRB2 family protein n=1 Tax=candidate division WWE3 bacterium TaxID=2053526 RepID=A0A831YZF0_UNCKA